MANWKRVSPGIWSDGTKTVRSTTNPGNKATQVAKTKTAAKTNKNATAADATAVGAVDMATANAAAAGLQERNATVGNLAQGALQGYVGGPLDLSGAPQRVGTGDLQADRQKYIDASYGLLTKNMERDKLRERELMQSELSNRGIQYSPDDDTSLWGRSMQGLDEKYKGYQDDALKTAITQSGTEMSNMADIQGTARDSFVNEAVYNRNLPINDATALYGLQDPNTLIQGGLSKYTADQQAKLQREQIAAQRARAGGGGGTTTPATTDPLVMGGYPTGFNI